MSIRAAAFLFVLVSACAGSQRKSVDESKFEYYIADPKVEFSVDRACYHKKCCQDGFAVLGFEGHSIFSADSRKKVVDAVVAAARAGSLLEGGTELSKERIVLTTEHEHYIRKGAPLATVVAVSHPRGVARAAMQSHRPVLALEIFVEIESSRDGKPHAAAIGVQWVEYNPDGSVKSSPMGQGLCGVIDTSERVVLSITSQPSID